MKLLLRIYLLVFCGLSISHAQPIDTLCAVNPVNTYRVSGWTGSTYNWEIVGGQFLSANGADSIRVQWNASPGTYTLRVQEIATTGCVGDLMEAEVLIIDPPRLEVFGPQNICEGEVAKIYATGGIDYVWSNGDVGDTIQVVAGFTEDFLVTSDTKCGFDQASFTLNVKPTPEVEAVPLGEEYVCPGETVEISAFGNAERYDWIGLGARQTVVVDKPGEYAVLATLNRCTATDTIVIDECRRIIVYNTFSPDGDGVNDFFEIDKIEFYPNARIEIYNRWGDQVYASQGNYTPWDGNWQGNQLPVSSYYYVIDLGDGSEAVSGYLNLIRK
jgi:gliding motility-associated-like protein